MLAPGAHLFCGRVTPELRQATDEAGVEVHEYDPDRELMLLRAPAIVEGAIHQTIEHTDVTINDARVVVVGYGNIGSLLARTLRGLGARVHVAARNPIQRAAAYADGATPLPLEELPALAPSLDMVFSTVPARVVGREVLERLPRGSLVLDIAPPPDHADLELAAELGIAPYGPAAWAVEPRSRSAGASGWGCAGASRRSSAAGRNRTTSTRRTPGGPADEPAVAFPRRRHRRRRVARAHGGARAHPAWAQAGGPGAGRRRPVGLLRGKRRPALPRAQHPPVHARRGPRRAAAHAEEGQPLLHASTSRAAALAAAVHGRGAGEPGPGRDRGAAPVQLRSLELHQALAADGLDTGLRALGAINVYETEKAFAGGRAEAQTLAAYGIKSQVMDPREARALEPALSDGVVGAVFYPDEAQCEPERFLLAASEAAAAAGAVIRTRAEVFDVRVKAGRVTALETTRAR